VLEEADAAERALKVANVLEDHKGGKGKSSDGGGESGGGAKGKGKKDKEKKKEKENRGQWRDRVMKFSVTIRPPPREEKELSVVV
jgi:hypothetical protein